MCNKIPEMILSLSFLVQLIISEASSSKSRQILEGKYINKNTE
jgi:hypothetical protein